MNSLLSAVVSPQVNVSSLVACDLVSDMGLRCMVLQGNQWSPSFCLYHHSTPKSVSLCTLPTVVPRGTVALLRWEKGKKNLVPSQQFPHLTVWAKKIKFKVDRALFGIHCFLGAILTGFNHL